MGRKASAAATVCDAAQAELDDEAILQGAPEPLDAALGLGRVGGDVADAEVPQDLAEVGGVLGALELFLEAPVGVVADEDAEAIAVEGHRAGRAARRAAASRVR